MLLVVTKRQSVFSSSGLTLFVIGKVIFCAISWPTWAHVFILKLCFSSIAGLYSEEPIRLSQTENFVQTGQSRDSIVQGRGFDYQLEALAGVTFFATDPRLRLKIYIFLTLEFTLLQKNFMISFIVRVDQTQCCFKCFITDMPLLYIFYELMKAFR